MTAADVAVERGWLGAGYGHPTAEAERAIELLADREGVALEPVYTGKAMAALLALNRRGASGDGPVLFWHTYGQFTDAADPCRPGAKRRRRPVSGSTAPPPRIRWSCGRSSSASRPRGHEVEVTAREYGQTEGILERLGIPYDVGRPPRRRRRRRQGGGRWRGAAWPGPLGARRGLRPRARPRLGRPRRWSRAALRIPSVQMQDYEYAGLQRQLAFRAARRVLVPDAIPVEAMRRAGAAAAASSSAIPGLKEDYYLADFEPDPAVLGELGLDRDRVLAVVRPPPETSAYHAAQPAL